MLKGIGKPAQTVAPWLPGSRHESTEETMASEQQLTRVQLLRRGGVIAAGLAVLGAPAAASAAETRHRSRKLKVYKLVTRSKGCTKRENRKRKCACKARYKHARYKLFPSKKAADGNRAHPQCDCRVKKAFRVKRSTYIALFGPPQNLRRYSADRRKKRTKKLLRRG